MGYGEDWLGYLHVFLDRLGPERETREAWLRRHPPAPHTWANWIAQLFGLTDDSTIDEDTVAEFAAAGLIAPDAAYETWAARTPAEQAPWDWSETPALAARYSTREFAFWSRRANPPSPTARAAPAEVPRAWRSFFARHLDGASESEGLDQGLDRDLDRGLDALAQFLATGQPPAPWALGLPVSSFTDSFADDIGYTDAYRLWLMSAFDDRQTFAAYARTQPAAPADWQAWLDAELPSV